MDQVLEADQICGNSQCRHPRREHKGGKEGKQCEGFLPTDRNQHGEAEEAEKECKCPYFHDDEKDWPTKSAGSKPR